jgi:Ca-activated chloride channel family protein
VQQGEEEELTDEQREQMQRMQNLLNRVPDDPAFLLKRKMQIESQRRKRERLPTNIQGNW